jgi:hypothetical protein
MNVVVEPTWHDNSQHDADQFPHDESLPTIDTRYAISMAEAVEWANGFSGPMTLYLYDENVDPMGVASKEGPVSIETGTYRHYKGGIYEVLGMARHSETEEDMVLYRSKATGGCWVRPASMWNEVVEHEGKSVRRFEKIDPNE